MKQALQYSNPGRRSLRMRNKYVGRFEKTIDPVIELRSLEDESEYADVSFKHKRRKVSKKIVYSDTESEHQSPMRKHVSKQRKKETKRHNTCIDSCQYPIVFNRCSAKQLVKAIKSFGDKQKRKVCEMGFGALISLHVEGIPRRLGYFVATNFDEKNMEITIPSRSIKVDEESIWRLLGIPKGSLDIDSIPTNSPWHPRVTEWRSIYGDEPINPSSIVARLKANVDDVSFNFYLDFIMLFVATMVEITPLGKCNLDLLDYITPETVFRKIKWCKYVLQRIKASKTRWNGSPNSPFTGGLTILILLYVDSLKFNGFVVNRSLPPLKFWDFDRLKEVEICEIDNGGFGRGEYIGMTKGSWRLDIFDLEFCNERKFEQNYIEEQFKVLESMLEKCRSKKEEIEYKLQFLPKEYHEQDRFKLMIMTFESIFNRQPLMEGVFNTTGTINVCESLAREDIKGKQKVSESEWISELCFEINNRRQEMIISDSEEDEDMVLKDSENNNEPAVSTYASTQGIPSFSLGLTQEGCSIEHSPKKAPVVNSLSDEMPSFSLGLTQEGNEIEHVSPTVNNVSSDDIPSFSLGLTQEFNVKENELTKGKEAILTATSPVWDKTPDMEAILTVRSTVWDKTPGRSPVWDKTPVFATKTSGSQTIRKSNIENLGVSKVNAFKMNSSKSETHVRDKTSDVVIPDFITAKEDAIWKYIFKEQLAQKRHTVMFEGRTIYTSDKYLFETEEGVSANVNALRSMNPGIKVSSMILECWSVVLNAEEKEHCKGKKRRLFFGPDIFHDWLYQPKKYLEDVRLVAFANRVDYTVGKVDAGKDLHKFQMLVFPIIEYEHYYTLVFDLEQGCIFLLDNLHPDYTPVSMKDGSLFSQKGMPYKIKEVVVGYLAKYMHANASILESAKIKRLSLPWSTNCGYTDSGIFTMRHMELFTASDDDQWESGFSKNVDDQTKQLVVLRKIYAARILLSHINKLNHEVLEEALK